MLPHLGYPISSVSRRVNGYFRPSHFLFSRRSSAFPPTRRALISPKQCHWSEGRNIAVFCHCLLETPALASETSSNKNSLRKHPNTGLQFLNCSRISPSASRALFLISRCFINKSDDADAHQSAS